MAPSLWQILIVLVIVLLLFGTKKLRNIGGDVGGAIKGFKEAMRDGEKQSIEHDSKAQTQAQAREEPVEHEHKS